MKLIYYYPDVKRNPLFFLGREYDLKMLGRIGDEVNPAFEEGLLELVEKTHSIRHLNKLKRASKFKQEIAELENPGDLFNIALRTADLSIKAAKEKAFALCVLPGHHASKEMAKGFCLINNMATAVNYLLDIGKKVCIIDIDGHHGDGTERLFSGNKDVLFFSLYQRQTYGSASRFNSLNTISQSIAPGSGDSELVSWLSSLREKILSFSPDLIGLSAGFDGYYKDSLLNLKYSLEGYRAAGREIYQFGIPSFALLEGGYHKDILKCINSFIEGYNNGRRHES